MSGRPADVRIPDLGNPQLPDFIRDVIRAAEATPVELSVENILDAAKQQAGLSDFGAMDFVERLGVICEALNEDADLTALGRVTNFTFLTRYATQRLRLEELYRLHPEIEDIEIEKPIVIAGLPRSGTTHLHNLIAEDKRLRSLPYWEALEPFPGPEDRVEPGGEDPRAARCQQTLAMQDQIMPYFKNMHEMHAWHVHEEIELIGMDFSTMLHENLAYIPRFRDYFKAHDQTPHYRYLKKALKALQFLRGPNRWVLKSPQHLAQLRPLRDTFPDATFVVTHRDPVAVIASMLTMQVYSMRMSRDPVRPKVIGKYWLDRIIDLLRGCVEDRDCLPTSQTIDVLFHEFMADDVAMVKKIYQLADLPFTTETQKAFDAYMKRNPRGKYGRVIYDLEGDFGVSLGELRERVGFYNDRFAVKLED